jgi:integrase
LGLAYYTGARPGKSELFTIRYEHCDWKRNRIEIYSSKTDKWRWQYVDKNFMGMLKRRYQRLKKMGIEPVYICNCLNSVDMDLAHKIGEIYSLRWDQMDWDNDRIRIRDEWLDLDMDIMKKLRRRFKGLKARGAIPDRICVYNNSPAKTFRKSWKRTKEEAGIKRRIRMYDIRHFHITYALADGAPIADVAERAGHVNTDMVVNVYLHIVDALRSKRAFKIPAIQIVDESVDNKKKGLTKSG